MPPYSVQSSGTAPFLQPAPCPPVLATNAKSQQVAIPLAGLVVPVANLLAQAPFVPNIFTFFIWPLVFESFSAGVLGAEITALTAAPWSWSVHCRTDYAPAFTPADIVLPTNNTASSFLDATAMGDTRCPLGAQVGLQLDQMVTLGFRLKIPAADAATYPNAVVLLDYFMSRTSEG